MTAPTSPTEPDDERNPMSPVEAKLRSEMDQLMAVSRDMVHAHGGLTTEEYKTRIADLERRLAFADAFTLMLQEDIERRKQCDTDAGRFRLIEVLDRQKAEAEAARDKAESDLAAARVTIGELVGALKPFGEVSAASDGLTVHGEFITDDTFLSDYERIWGKSLTIGDCHHAAALVSRHQAQQ